MARTALPTIPTLELAALSFAAYRANGNNVYKDDRVFDEESQELRPVIPNKSLMYHALKDAATLEVTAEDHEQARVAMDALLQDHMLRTLAGSPISAFSQSFVELISEETVTQRSAGLMAYLPRSYNSVLKMRAQQNTLLELGAGSQYLGTVGSKIEVDFTLLSKKYQEKFGCWTMFGHDPAGNLVQFLTQHEHLAQDGRITGKIKRTEQNRWHNNARVTDLNYVKRI